MTCIEIPLWLLISLFVLLALFVFIIYRQYKLWEYETQTVYLQRTLIDWQQDELEKLRGEIKESDRECQL